ncbi:MAG TPA: helix-turn-helix domain-containing protein [Xanthobacteraceae bacterium]
MSPAVAESWHRFDIRRIEDLNNAVLGAELEAIQMAGPHIKGSLAFAAHDGVIFSSGLIDGKVAIRGPLSRDAITLFVGLKFGPGSRHWLNEVTDGDVSVVLPGDEHDAFYTAGSLYLTATLTAARLEQEVARERLVFNRSLGSRTGLHSTPICSPSLDWLRSQVAQIHNSGTTIGDRQPEIGRAMLRMVVSHYLRLPPSEDGRVHLQRPARIVHRAREYIRENLTAPISIDALAAAAETSRRTLYRVFLEVLEDAPQSYVRRLRLHRIRRELISATEATCTVSAAGRHWGFGGDMDRLSGTYRELFGETPAPRSLLVTRISKPTQGCEPDWHELHRRLPSTL